MPGAIPPDAIDTFSRTLAVGVLMLVPGGAGYYADRWLGTNFLTMVGFILGMIAGIGILIVQSKKMELERKAALKKKLEDSSNETE